MILTHNNSFPYLSTPKFPYCRKYDINDHFIHCDSTAQWEKVCEIRYVHPHINDCQVLQEYMEEDA